jgi:hypothetical protein
MKTGMKGQGDSKSESESKKDLRDRRCGVRHGELQKGCGEAQEVTPVILNPEVRFASNHVQNPTTIVVVNKASPRTRYCFEQAVTNRGPVKSNRCG